MPHAIRSLFLASLFLLGSTALSAQYATQTLQGQVQDQNTLRPLTNAKVELLNHYPLISTITDSEGQFKLYSVPVGRQRLRIVKEGYATKLVTDILVAVGGDNSLRITLDAESQPENIDLKAPQKKVTWSSKDDASDAFSIISVQPLIIEDVSRFAGTRNDPARLVSNFAGISVLDDARNDISVRGNSPLHVRWMLEGVPIFSPNHLSPFGARGGFFSMLNPNAMQSSDFYKGALPAMYGNALGGVYDIKLRRGSSERLRSSAQLAITGLEAMVEGPMTQRKEGSFLIGYRYSVFGLLQLANVDFGSAAVPIMRDGVFKINFPEGKQHAFSVFGNFGNSRIELDESDYEYDGFLIDRNESTDYRYNSSVFGLKHRYLINQRSYLRTTLAVSGTYGSVRRDSAINGQREQLSASDDNTLGYSLSSVYNTELSAALQLRMGSLNTLYSFDNYYEHRRNAGTVDAYTHLRRDFQGRGFLSENYVQLRYRPKRWLSIVGGLRAQYWAWTQELAWEPRLATRLQFGRHRLALGYALQHQTQNFNTYLYQSIEDNAFEETNQDLGFTRSHHLNFSYQLYLANTWRLRVESYYQLFDQVPISYLQPQYSALSNGLGLYFLPRISDLQNDGIGYSRGVELTLEKHFQNGIYLLANSSLFDAQYRAADGNWYNSPYNKGYTNNLLFGQEVKMGKAKNNLFHYDIKFRQMGGNYFTPIDTLASRAAGREIRLNEAAFSERFPDYFRFDFRFGFRFNGPRGRISQRFFVDIINVFGFENVLDLQYVPTAELVVQSNQLGLFPTINYRINF